MKTTNYIKTCFPIAYKGSGYEMIDVNVKAYLYKDECGRLLALHRPYYDGKHSKKDWVVTEFFTGLALGCTQATTRVEAMENAKTRLKKTKEISGTDFKNRRVWLEYIEKNVKGKQRIITFKAYNQRELEEIEQEKKRSSIMKNIKDNIRRLKEYGTTYNVCAEDLPF